MGEKGAVIFQPINDINSFQMKIRQLANLIKSKADTFTLSSTRSPSNIHYRPTPYLSHPFLQSVYNISQPLFPSNFQRQKIFFQDGGHISLDWVPSQNTNPNPPILFIMHGLTGGSEMNYIKELMSPASGEGYCCVCLNSRGINSQMTSPHPFTGMNHIDLEAALKHITNRYPMSPIYMVGTSFGGNYLLRYLLRCKPISRIESLVVLAPPLNVTRVVEDMGAVYQRFFVKRYIQETVLKHQMMKHWQEVGLVDMKQVKLSTNLMEFHTSLTAKILGYPSAKEIFDQYTIKEEEIQSLKVKTLFMLSKDDPIVSYSSMPLQSLQKNKYISIQTTQKGGHLCWFQGIKPKRWYPKPVLQYFRNLREVK